MEEKNKREEIQSRREFFKKAAKAALPVVGAAILSSVLFMNAEAAPSGCTGTCYGTCYGACKGCENTCSGTCKNACEGCEYTCSGTCKNGSY